MQQLLTDVRSLLTTKKPPETLKLTIQTKIIIKMKECNEYSIEILSVS